jgi:hypothetical protein
MSGEKFDQAKRACISAIAALKKDDRVAIELFDSQANILVELGDAAGALRLQEALRASLGIRFEVIPVPLRSLPPYELKARRVVRR